MMAKRFFASFAVLYCSILFLSAQDSFYEISVYHKLVGGSSNVNNLNLDSLDKISFFYSTRYDYSGNTKDNVVSLALDVKSIVNKNKGADYEDLKPLRFFPSLSNFSRRIEDVFGGAVLYFPQLEPLNGGVIISLVLNNKVNYLNHELQSQNIVLGSKEVKCYITTKRENSVLKFIMILEDQTVLPKSVPGGKPLPPTPFPKLLPNGDIEYPVELRVLGGTHETDSRISIFPIIVDCLTEDTVDFLNPFVYEGATYHELQDKRKSFDYIKYDPLGGKRSFARSKEIRKVNLVTTYKEDYKKDANGNVIYKKNSDGSVVVNSDGEAVADKIIVPEVEKKTVVYDSLYFVAEVGFRGLIDTLRHDTTYVDDDKTVTITIKDSIIYHKPKKDRNYKCILRYTIEDYHHVYDYDEDLGSCIISNPFKFLQMSSNAVSLPLDRDRFYEIPMAQRMEGTVPNLNINFVHGTPTIIRDSMYYATLAEVDKHISEIRNSNGKLLDGEMVAYASPDGKDARNIELAKQRASAAIREINLPIRIDPTPLIDTWDHTAVMLDSLGFPQEAQVLRDLIPNYTDNYSIGKALQNQLGASLFNSVVMPVLRMQCRISFRYGYHMEKLLSPVEAKNEYEKNRNRRFYPGDYFNLFEAITDSAEHDTLTEVAYNRLILQNRNLSSVIAPYVINEMAVLKIKRMQPDTLILQDAIHLVDGQLGRIPYKQGDGLAVKNLPEVVMNQAIMYYLEDDFDHAKLFLNRLKQVNYSSEAYNSLMAFIDFKESLSSGVRDSSFRRAVKYIEDASPINKAVLYVEFPELGKQSEAFPEIYKLDDASPLKWYLMGLLWAGRDHNQSSYRILPDIVAMSNRASSDVNISGIPFYMAYFQKCFDLDKSFMKYYFQEGKVTDQMRQRANHAYKVSRIPAYRALFDFLKQQDDEDMKELEYSR